MTLKEANVGEKLIVLQVQGAGALRQRLLDLGLLPGTQVTITGAAPLGDPLELTLRGYPLTLRRADGARVEVAPAEEESPQERRWGLC